MDPKNKLGHNILVALSVVVTSLCCVLVIVCPFPRIPWTSGGCDKWGTLGEGCPGGTPRPVSWFHEKTQHQTKATTQVKLSFHECQQLSWKIVSAVSKHSNDKLE